MLRLLREKYHIAVNWIIVSEEQKRKQDIGEIDGVPVMELSVFEQPEKGALCLYSIQNNGEELYQKARKGFERIIRIRNSERNILEAFSYIQLFNEKNIDIENEWLTIGGIKFPNPFYSDYQFCNAWISAANDLILPEFFDDNSMITEGPYEFDRVKLNENDVVLDCGANIGVFSAIAAAKGCKVIAFEPDYKIRHYLEHSLKPYKDRIVIEPYALYKQNAELTFEPDEQPDHITGGKIATSCWKTNLFKVEAVCLDSYIKQKTLHKVDFIKADIEGAERELLTGAEMTIREYSPRLSLCTYHLPDDPEFLESRIKEIRKDYHIEHRWKKLFAYSVV